MSRNSIKIVASKCVPSALILPVAWVFVVPKGVEAILLVDQLAIEVRKRPFPATGFHAPCPLLRIRVPRGPTGVGAGLSVSIMTPSRPKDSRIGMTTPNASTS